MSNTPIDLKAVVVHNFVTREYGTEHHRLIDEITYGRALQNGDDSAIEAMVGAISSPDNGMLSKDPLTNIKYFYITGVTCTVRFCITGGMDEQEAYYTSDLFIQSLDNCDTIVSVQNLCRKMVEFYLEKMRSLKRAAHCSKCVYDCINYIYEHMHEKISTKDLAEYKNVSPGHLERLFQKELGTSITELITVKKMDTAKKMLLFSDYKCSEIAYYLGYSSQSYFSKTFQRYYKTSPLEYRKRAHQLPFIFDAST